MIKNYFKITLRNLLRHKVYSFINISGLSLGIACCLLLVLYIQDELSYDKHHQRLNELYRVGTHFHGQEGTGKSPAISPPIAMMLKNVVPEVEAAARVLSHPGVSHHLVRYDDNIFYETNGFMADSTLFEIFTYELIAGNPEKALTEPNTVVISETLAHKIFGDEPAIDKSITISEGESTVHYRITGVFRDEANSFLQASFFTSIMGDGFAEFVRENSEWGGQNFVPSYVRLAPGHSEYEVEKKINEVLVKYGAENMKALGMNKTLFIEPLKDIYLKSETDQSPRITSLYVIASIAGFILLIACINFMNLSTAKATKRAAEIGIRKVMGAYRSSLISQILGEAMVLVFISVVISVILVQVALPSFNQLAGKNISFNTHNAAFFLTALAMLTFFTGLLAGSYPAFYISSFQPARVLKGKFVVTNASGWLRQSLTVFQFVVAIVLVCGVLVISRQLSFMQQKDPGFDASAKIVLPLRTNSALTQYETLKKEFQKIAAVEGVSGTERLPGTRVLRDLHFYTAGGSMDDAIAIKRNVVDVGYLELLKIKLITGRSFTAVAPDKHGQVILNETAVKQLGMKPDDIVGRLIYSDWQGQRFEFEVIGVMADYNQTSLRDEIVATMFEQADEPTDHAYLVAGVSPGEFERTIASLEKTWKTLVAGTPFEYSFLDDNIQKQYDEYRKVSAIMTDFTIIALVICSLGLYGLSSFMAEQRFKEIGIRKVMGASIAQIAGMMSKEFIKLVAVAFAIAIPLAWYTMDRWLEDFAYKITMGPSVFIYAGLGAMIIALITVSYESIRAASANPIDSLRNE